jgi:chorismate mutase / prephenate dehydratase
MPKKRPAKANSHTKLTAELNRLDRQLVKMMNDRANIVRLLATKETGKSMLPDSNQQVSKAIDSSRGPLDERSLRAAFRELVSGCRVLSQSTKVAYLGPQYSYTHLATVERFGSSAELVPVGTIAAVFEELDRGHADFGVVPLENSTDGRVVDTLGMFARMPVRICGEVQLRIHHNLLAKCSRGKITEVYSKPQALSQCRDWLAKHLPTVRTVEMSSTAAAAQLAVEKPGAAAVASRLAGMTYGLDFVAESIEDNQDNITRFAIIGGDTAAPTGQDKTAVMCEIPHQPGSLADIMAIFKKTGLNMTWIESFPMSGSNSEYLFFIELEGHQVDPDVERAVKLLAKKTDRLEILGSYATSEPVE